MSVHDGPEYALVKLIVGYGFCLIDNGDIHGSSRHFDKLGI